MLKLLLYSSKFLYNKKTTKYSLWVVPICRAYYVGGMEADCLHFKPGEISTFQGKLWYDVVRNYFILQKFARDFPVTVTHV